MKVKKTNNVLKGIKWADMVVSREDADDCIDTAISLARKFKFQTWVDIDEEYGCYSEDRWMIFSNKRLNKAQIDAIAEICGIACED